MRRERLCMCTLISIKAIIWNNVNAKHIVGSNKSQDMNTLYTMSFFYFLIKTSYKVRLTKKHICHNFLD